MSGGASRVGEVGEGGRLGLLNLNLAFRGGDCGGGGSGVCTTLSGYCYDDSRTQYLLLLYPFAEGSTHDVFINILSEPGELSEHGRWPMRELRTLFGICWWLIWRSMAAQWVWPSARI